MNSDTVFHAIYGRGKVISTRTGGNELCVRFDRGFTHWVWRYDVTLSDTEAVQPSVQSAATPQQVVSECGNAQGTISRVKERRIIHALRLGIVPDDLVADFTFGRDEEVECLLNWLGGEQHKLLSLVGTYGSGKTHLLNHIARRAVDAGFAVASMQVDAKEAPFFRPLRVYQRLMDSLTYRLPGGVGQYKVQRLLQQALHKGALKDHIFFKHLSCRSTDEELLRWLTGNGATRPQGSDLPTAGLPGLYDHANAANLYCYLLSGLGWAACQLGLKGLLLIFDEAETLTVQLAKRQREMGYNFYGSLCYTAINHPMMLQSPSLTGFEYSKISEAAANTSFLYKPQSGIKLLFAFAQESEDEEEEEEGESESEVTLQSLHLSSLGDEARRNLFDQIAAMYCRAYRLEQSFDKETTFAIVDALTYTMTRQFVKGCVEALDLIRHSPGVYVNVDEVLR